MDRINSDDNIDAMTNGEELLLLNELPKFQDGIVFDVGANVGNWARYAIKVIFPRQQRIYPDYEQRFETLNIQIGWPGLDGN